MGIMGFQAIVAIIMFGFAIIGVIGHYRNDKDK